MIDFATLVLKADSRGLVDGRDAMRDLGNQAGATEKRVTTSTERMSQGMTKLAARAGALAAVLAPAALFGGAVSEGRKFETLTLKTQQIIRATGGVAGKTADELREQARQVALSTLESTEGVMEAQQTLLTFRNVQGDVFDRAISSAADLTAALGGNLQSNTLQLAKALEDPVQGLSALSRSGTVFTEQQKEMVKEMVEAGRVADAQNFILQELEAQYGGAAVAAAQGLAGAQDTLGQRMQELLLQIDDSLNITGNLTIVYNAMANAVLYVTERIEDLTTFVRENAERLQSYGMAAAAAFAIYMAPAVLAGTRAIYGFITALRLSRAALIATGWGIFVVLVGELAYQVTNLADRLGGFGNMMRLVGEVAKEVWERFKFGAKVAQYSAMTLWQAFKYHAFTAMQSGVDAVYNGVENIIASFVGAKDAIIAVWDLIPAAMGDLIYQGVNAVIAGVERMINAVIERMNEFIEKIEGALNLLPEWAVGEGGVNLGEIKLVDLPPVENEYAGAATRAGEEAAEAFNAAFEKQYLDDPPTLFGDMATEASILQAEYAVLAATFKDLAGRPLTSVQAIRDALAESGIAAGETEEEIRNVAQAIADINEQTQILDEGGGGGGGGEGPEKGLPSALNDLVPTVQKLEGAAGRMQAAFADAFTDVIMGATSAKDALRGLLEMAARAFLNAAIQNAVAFAFAAKDGAVMSGGNVVPFADGGVVGGPTAFPMSGGRTGLMGEAGPEAIMPLKRGTDGKLGVEAHQRTERIELAVYAEEGEMFVPRVRQISGNVAVQVSSQANQAQKQAFGSTLTQYDQRGTTV